MWLPLTLLVLAGAVTANDNQHGWKDGSEYTYLIRSRTLTSLAKLSDQYTGILLKGLLTVQAKDPQTLVAKVSKGQYAQIHSHLPNGWESEISDQLLELEELPISEKPFQIKVKNGVIRDLIVEKNTPSWEVNLLKSIVSQLQVDLQGKNAIRSSSGQVPNGDDEPYGMFKAMEDSVGGSCEVLYDITPLPDYMSTYKPELVPMPELKGDGIHIDVMKTKNFSRCDQRMDYHFGITGQTNWEPGSNDNGKFLTKSSSSRIIVSGSLKRFAIQSSVTTSQMFLSPRFYDYQNGIVVSKMNLTLRGMNRISRPMQLPRNPESTGNLVYVYNNPFSDSEERRTPRPNDASKLNQDSTSDDDSSSSISSSEDNTFWQPRPGLAEAPQNPLLPNFVGYKGKFVGKSDEFDVIEAAKELISEIAKEIEDPSSIPDNETLEKFTILCSLIRTMSRKQIMEAEGNLASLANELKSNDRSQIMKQNAWAVFRDAITQAGTGPALLTISHWIEKKVVRGFEAADIVSRIPKNARTPTAEYIRELFNLATNRKVRDEPYLNSTAILAFTELVHHAQINKKALHNNYPVHAFGRMVSKDDQAVKDEYLPFLERELTNAIKNGNSPQIQTYIMALGNLGHPKILAVFEPYLEGSKKVSVFQRTMMVASLGKLAEMHPKLARSVLYKIYMNTMEAHEVRCTAVFLLMKTNPPLSMLQRMAEFTNYDTNKQVNSAVKSILESTAKLTNPESMDLTRKARAAMNLLSPTDYSYFYSHGHINDWIAEEENQAQRSIINYIGSDDSLLPRSLYLGSFASYSEFKTPPTEIMAMISNVKSVLDELSTKSDDKERSGRTATEKIAEELNIIPDEPIALEGNLQWNSKLASRFWPFDKEAIRKIQTLVANCARALQDGDYVNLKKLMSYEVTLSFPTETGLPFVYTYKVSTLYKLSATGQLQIDSDMNMNLKGMVRPVYSKKIQGRIGFVAPFIHQHFISGVDVNLHSFTPVGLAVDINRAKKNVQLKLWPLRETGEVRLIHYSVIPYTSNHNILSRRPLSTEQSRHMVFTDQVHSKNNNFEISESATLKIDAESDKSNDEFWNTSFDNLRVNFMTPTSLENDNDKYRKVDIFLNLKEEQKEPITFSVSYDSMTSEPGSEDPQQWTPTVKAVAPSNNDVNSVEYKKQCMKEAMKGIRSAESNVVVMQLELPGAFKSRSALSLAWSSSNAENKERVLANWFFQRPKENIKFEMCAATQSSSNVNPLLPYDQLRNIKPKTEFDVEVRYGESCRDGQSINIKGQSMQSDNLREKIRDFEVMNECLEQMKHGNKKLQACQSAAAVAATMDVLELSMDTETNNVQELLEAGVHMLGNADILKAHVNTLKPRNAGKRKVDAVFKLSEDLETGEVTLHTAGMDAKYKDLKFTEFGVTADDILGTDDQTSLDENAVSGTCVLDKTRAETFDGRSYPLRLGNCWHVVMTTYPKLNPENRDEKLRISEDESFSILSRETESGEKEVKILIGKQEIKLRPSGSQSEVKLDGKVVEITRDASHNEKQEEEVVFQIIRLQDNSIAVVSDKYDVNIVYDGSRTLIQTTDQYRKSIRGLCGDFDGNESNDFLGPRSCFLNKPELFIGSYALTSDQCEGEALENAKQAKRSECMVQKRNRQSNVISDVDAGRVTVEGRKLPNESVQKHSMIHRTKVIEVNGKLCFSMRPVVSCASNYTATETKNKNYQFHCMDKNAASLNLKKRIEKGANPDLSQKSVSMSRAISVPIACQA